MDFARPRKARRRKMRDQLSQYLRNRTRKPEDPEVHAYLQEEARRRPYARFVIQAILDTLRQWPRHSSDSHPHRMFFWL